MTLLSSSSQIYSDYLLEKVLRESQNLGLLQLYCYETSPWNHSLAVVFFLQLFDENYRGMSDNKTAENQPEQEYQCFGDHRNECANDEQTK